MKKKGIMLEVGSGEAPLGKLGIDFLFAHTGQHCDYNMSQQFIQEVR